MSLRNFFASVLGFPPFTTFVWTGPPFVPPGGVGGSSAALGPRAGMQRSRLLGVHV